MADVYKVLFQAKPAATTLVDAYTASSTVQAIISSIVICNQVSTATSYRLSVAVAGTADATKQYIAFDAPIQGNEVIALTLGLTLAPTDVLRVYNAAATLSFNGFGVEKS